MTCAAMCWRMPPTGPLRQHLLARPARRLRPAPGLYFCLGTHLAHREIAVILGELLTRVPDIRAAGQPDYLLSSFINGIKHLPREFG